MTSRFGFSEIDFESVLSEFQSFKSMSLGTDDPQVLREALREFFEKKYEGFSVPNHQNSGIEKFLPKNVLVRELRFKGKGPNLDIEYSRGYDATSNDHIPQLPTDSATLKAFLLAFHEEKFPRGKDYKKQHQASKYQETHLSLNCPEKSIVILKLPENGNLQFNRSGAPISFSKDHTSDFGVVGKVLPSASGNVVISSKVYEGKSDDGSRTAFFLAPKLSNDEYRPFNIHLDIVGKKKNGSDKYFIPIIIDPDVRHPGGGTDP